MCPLAHFLFSPFSPSSSFVTLSSESFCPMPCHINTNKKIAVYTGASSIFASIKTFSCLIFSSRAGKHKVQMGCAFLSLWFLCLEHFEEVIILFVRTIKSCQSFYKSCLFQVDKMSYWKLVGSYLGGGMLMLRLTTLPLVQQLSV